MTRLELLEKVNQLNLMAVRDERCVVYWTVTVMYNTVIYMHDADAGTSISEVIKGVPK